MERDKCGRRKRSVERNIQAPEWLICCEGKSEAIYFNDLLDCLNSQYQDRISARIYVGIKDACESKETCGACGRQHLNLYNKCMLCSKRGLFQKIWIVFDLDADCDPENKKKLLKSFSETVKKCVHERIINAAWSIPCFEYWLALHSGNYIDAGSVQSFKSKIQDMGNSAIDKKMPCNKKYQNQTGEKHCKLKCPKICEKVLAKPYYNGFTAFGGLDGVHEASQMCKKRYDEEDTKKLSKFKFDDISCCSNIHCMISEIFQYYCDLPIRK